MVKGFRKGAVQLVGALDPEPMDPESLCDICKHRIIQGGTVIDDTGGLHFELDKAERTVVEDDHFDRQLGLCQRDEVAEHHGETTVTGEGDNLAIAMRCLCADRLGYGIRHAAVVERAEQSAPAVHRQVSRRPDHGCADIGDEDRVVGRQLVDSAGDKLGTHRRLVAVVHGC